MWPEGVTNVDGDADIIDAPEDGGCYVASISRHQRSETFQSAQDALDAYESGTVQWRDY